MSAGAIHGVSFVSKQKGRSIRYYKKYCNDPRFMGVRSWIKTGDFIGVDFCYHELPEKLDIFRNMGYEKNVIILTRPAGYEKKPEKRILSTLFYRKYPEFSKVLKHRYISYNESMKYIERLEKEGKVLVIRPKKALDIGRLENNPEKTQEIYDVGYQDGLKMIEKVKAFLDAK